MKNSLILLLIAVSLGVAAIFVLTFSRSPEPAALLLVGAVTTGGASFARHRIKRGRASVHISEA